MQSDYVKMPIKLNPYTESGTTYNNYYMFLMDFLTYGADCEAVKEKSLSSKLKSYQMMGLS